MSVMLDRLASGGDELPLLAAAFGCFLVQQVLAPFQPALGEAIARRVDRRCLHRLLAVSFRRAPIPALEDPGTLDKLADIRAAFDGDLPTPGRAVAGALALVARYSQLVGAVVLVAVVLGAPAAVAVGVSALVVRFGQRGSLGRFAALWDGLAGARRRVLYLRRLAAGPEAAKEIRVLGLRGWLSERHRQASEEYLGPLWAGRRRLLAAPFLGYAAVGLAGAAYALVELARAGAGGTLTVLQLAIGAQAVLIPIRFGVYFPESDVQTQFGVQAYRALADLEARVERVSPPGAGTDPVAGAGVAARTQLVARPVAASPRGEIRFQDVHFAYPGGSPVFAGLDLTLPAGRSTALVGLNGAGKTTLVKLLAGFYRPDQGTISIDGRDLRELDGDSWHRQLAVIFQNFIRYELTAAENIGLGAPGRRGDLAAVRDAARQASVLDVLDDLPAGLATPLYSRHTGGQDLSGGQWQRVALARALFAVRAGASVLVLDEPTAHLDVRAEADFYHRFLETTAGLTSLVISHRFSTVRRADHIAVLERGRVVEYGDHDGLLASGGRYAEMFALQARHFVDLAGGGAEPYRSVGARRSTDRGGPGTVEVDR
ncbi:ABC transporter ATP-binding protein [Micromonospora craterilacus]|uniref:ABC transporter ATP-binding protein n=2 Tax=Micromonospora craterilacus TaxID=1655439 RepID=A0A2W2E194_9ACTN|nr:ABC transporter ATP-binding protein [Micromonospora craterilacus]